MKVFGSLLNGATLRLYNISRNGIAFLPSQLVRDEVTVLRLPVALFRLFMGILSENDLFPDLRLILLGGDAIFKKDVERFRKQFSTSCLLGHQLACTEAGIIAFHIINCESELVDNIVPAGYPIDDKEVLILDKAGQQVEFGQVGEIAVKSCFNSPGYWLEPYLSGKKFLSDKSR